MRLRHFWVAIICLFICAALVVADTLKLKDGTVLEGRVLSQGDNYWIKLPNGESRLIPKNQVATFTPGDSKPLAGAGTPAPSPAKPINGSSSSFASLKSKIDHTVDQPLVAVTMWEKFVDSKPAPGDLEAAQSELNVWKQRQKDNAERIKGKWVGGDEKKKLMKQVDGLIQEGTQLFKDGQTIAGVKKMEDALALYPQSFLANFELGDDYLHRGVMGADGRGNPAYIDKAIKSLETAAKILPTSAATWSNLAIGYNFKRRYADSVRVAYKGAKIHESKDTVQNLINALMAAPPGMREQGDIKTIMADTIQMAAAHGVPIQLGTWLYIPPTESNTKEGGEDPDVKAPPGAAWSGSGFFVSSDGYLITNHHVAAGDAHKPLQKDISFRVRMDDETEKNAEVIAICEEADIAIMKIKVDAPVPFLKIADDNPNQAAKALVLGYPATGEEHPTLQISEGTVKSVHPDEEYNVWYDLNTTHGNSGGPIVDRDCRLIGILTAGRTEYNMTIVLGVGPNQIKAFLTKLGDKAPKVSYAKPGTETFDGEKLTQEARKCTVFVLAVRGLESNGDSGNGGDSPEPGDGGK